MLDKDVRHSIAKNIFYQPNSKFCLLNFKVVLNKRNIIIFNYNYGPSYRQILNSI